MSDGLTDKECKNILVNWWMNFFLLKELTQREENEIELFKEKYPDETPGPLEVREMRKKRILKYFHYMAEGAVENIESRLTGRLLIDKDTGEGYEMNITLTKKVFTEDETKDYSPSILYNIDDTCMDCKHGMVCETGPHCTLHNKKITLHDTCSDWNK